MNAPESEKVEVMIDSRVSSWEAEGIVKLGHRDVRAVDYGTELAHVPGDVAKTGCWETSAGENLDTQRCSEIQSG